MISLAWSLKTKNNTTVCCVRMVHEQLKKTEKKNKEIIAQNSQLWLSLREKDEIDVQGGTKGDL